MSKKPQWDTERTLTHYWRLLLKTAQDPQEIMGRIQRDFSAEYAGDQQLYRQWCLSINADLTTEALLTSCLRFLKKNLPKNHSSEITAMRTLLRFLVKIEGHVASQASAFDRSFIQNKYIGELARDMSKHLLVLKRFVESPLELEQRVMVLMVLTIVERAIDEEPYRSMRSWYSDLDQRDALSCLIRTCQVALAQLSLSEYEHDSDDALTDHETISEMDDVRSSASLTETDDDGQEQPMIEAISQNVQENESAASASWIEMDELSDDLIHEGYVKVSDSKHVLSQSQSGAQDKKSTHDRHRVSFLSGDKEKKEESSGVELTPIKSPKGKR